jgi:hypothetical protein
VTAALAGFRVVSIAVNVPGPVAAGRAGALLPLARTDPDSSGDHSGAAFHGGNPEALFTPKLRPLFLFQYDGSPDGQRFLVLRTVKDQNEPPLTVVQNWTKEIAER